MQSLLEQSALLFRHQQEHHNVKSLYSPTDTKNKKQKTTITHISTTTNSTKQIPRHELAHLEIH